MLFGSLGLSVLALSAVVHPLLVVFLGLALLRFVLGYRRHRNPWPLTVGVVAAAGLYAGKWLVFSEPILYAGAALLIASSLVDTVLLRRVSACRIPDAPKRKTTEVSTIPEISGQSPIAL